MKESVKIKVNVEASVAKTWNFWTQPEHIKHWNQATPDWHTTAAENNLEEGGRFSYRMEARDGTSGFDFEGTYTKVRKLKTIAYIMSDGRKVELNFIPAGDKTLIEEIFDPEEENSVEMQTKGWQAILNNFKEYTENTE